MSGVPCPDCFSGSVNPGVPSGTEETIHGLPTYVIKPEGEPKGLIVIIADAFGWNVTNSRLLADSYSKRGGYLVYIPDFMNGHGCSTSVMKTMKALMSPASIFTTIFLKPFYFLNALSHFLPFIIWCRASVCKPRIYDFFKALRTSPETANMKIATAGFCWGGLYVVSLAHDTPSSRVHRPGSESGQVQRLVDASYTAHPSSLALPADIVNVTTPLSISIGDADFAMGYKQVLLAKDILEKKDGGHEVVIYPGARHGFAVRSDPDDKVQVELAEKAEEQALSWFAKWLV